MKTVSFTQPHIVPNLYDLVFFQDKRRRYDKEQCEQWKKKWTTCEHRKKKRKKGIKKHKRNTNSNMASFGYGTCENQKCSASLTKNLCLHVHIQLYANENECWEGQILRRPDFLLWEIDKKNHSLKIKINVILKINFFFSANQLPCLY